MHKKKLKNQKKRTKKKMDNNEMLIVQQLKMLENYTLLSNNSGNFFLCPADDVSKYDSDEWDIVNMEELEYELNKRHRDEHAKLAEIERIRKEKEDQDALIVAERQQLEFKQSLQQSFDTITTTVNFDINVWYNMFTLPLVTACPNEYSHMMVNMLLDSFSRYMAKFFVMITYNNVIVERVIVDGVDTIVQHTMRSLTRMYTYASRIVLFHDDPINVGTLGTEPRSAYVDSVGHCRRFTCTASVCH